MNLSIDKRAHFLGGIAMSATLVVYGVSPAPASVVGVFIGLMKELVDPLFGGQRDFLDFVATAVGSTSVLPVELIS